MLDLTTLSHAVFHTEARRFDPNTTYFSVLIDTPAFAPLYSAMRSRISYLLPENQIAWVHKEDGTALTQEELDEAISGIAERLDRETWGEPPKRRYFLFAYYDDSHTDGKDLFSLLSSLPNERGDAITVILCLSARMEAQNAVLDRVARGLEACGRAVELYLYAVQNGSYYRRVLIDSMGAAVVLNTDFAECANRQSRKRDAENHVAIRMAQLGEDGVDYLSRFPSVSWSTMCGRYFDRRHDFLSKYLSDLCRCLKQPQESDFQPLLRRIYAEVLPQPEARGIKPKLRDAIALIPSMTPTPPKRPTGTLSSYFVTLYGEKGSYYVDLTLSAMLSRLLRGVSEKPVKAAATMIFDEMAQYHLPDLAGKVCEMFEGYLQKLRPVARPDHRALESILNADMSAEHYDESMDSYIDAYYRMHLTQIEMLFWEETLRYIKSHTEEFSTQCEQARTYFEQIATLQNEVKGSVQDGEIVYHEAYSAREVLHLAQNQARCDEIRAIYERLPENAYAGEAPRDCKHVFVFDLDPGFYRSYSLTLPTATYLIYGCAYNGKYLVHIGGEGNG